MIKYNKLSSNGIVGLTYPSNGFDLNNKKIVTRNYVDNKFNEKFIKVLEEGLKEISERIYIV